MDKKEAETEALRLWRELPQQNRSDIVHALAFAQLIAKQLPFKTLGQHDKIVQAWLVRDQQRSMDASKGVDRAKGGVSGSTAPRTTADEHRAKASPFHKSL